MRYYSVDPDFSPDEQSLASKAVTEWDEVTSPRICLRVSSAGTRIRPVVDESEMSAMDAAAKIPDGARVIGWWDGKNIKVALPRIHDRRVVYSVVLHEVGHSLGLPHYFGEGASHMRPSVGPAWDWKVPDADSNHFRTVHHW